MEAETDEVTPAASDSKSVSGNAERSELVRALGLGSLMLWGLAVVISLIGRGNPFSFSLTTLAGFYLVCGNARAWIRWLGVFATIILVNITHFGPERFVMMAYLGVFATYTAGLTYAFRMMLSALRKESSPRQRFTIFGLMLATAITAACLGVLNLLFGRHGAPMLVLIFAFMLMPGLIMTAQCLLTWARTWRQALTLAPAILLGTMLACLMSYWLLKVVDDTPPSVDSAVIFMLMMAFMMWPLVYLLWFSSYALGWTLIDPSWKLGPRYEAAPSAETTESKFDVLMEDPDDGITQ